MHCVPLFQPGTFDTISCGPSADSGKLFKTSLPFDRHQSTEGLVVLNLFPSQCLWKLLLGIISKGVWSQSALTLQWFRGGDVKTILVSPLWGRGQLREVSSDGKKCTQILRCSFEALALLIPMYSKKGIQVGVANIPWVKSIFKVTSSSRTWVKLRCRSCWVVHTSQERWRLDSWMGILIGLCPQGWAHYEEKKGRAARSSGLYDKRNRARTIQ